MTAAWGNAAVAAAEGAEPAGNPLVWGVGAFVIFMVMLAITLALGRGRG